MPADSKEYARNILNKLYNKIFVEKLIRYTEIQDMKQDDTLEDYNYTKGGKLVKALLVVKVLAEKIGGKAILELI